MIEAAPQTVILCLWNHKLMYNMHTLYPHINICLEYTHTHTIKNKCNHQEIFKIIFENITNKRQSTYHEFCLRYRI